MVAHEARSIGYYTGKKWFQWAVLFLLIGALAIGLISALNDAKVVAERQMLDLTIRNMRTGMQLAMGEALMQGRQREIADWAGSNPLRWLGTKPVGYRGECTRYGAKALQIGEWCFDATRSELAYRPRAAPDQCEVLRWRVTGSSERGNSSEGLIGLKIESVTKCL